MKDSQSWLRLLEFPPGVLARGMLLILCAVPLRIALADAEFPLLFPMLTALLVVFVLYIFHYERDPAGNCARTGFYLGVFIFLLLTPIFFPEQASPEAIRSTEATVNMALVLTCLGFESAYATAFVLAPGSFRALLTRPFAIREKDQRMLLGFLWTGIAIWVIYVLNLSNALGVSMFDLLLNVRTAVEGANPNPELAPRYFYVIFSAGILLAGTAAAVLLITQEKVSTWTLAVCTFSLFLCAGVGFLSGSRAYFLYTVIPLVATYFLRFLKLLRSNPVFRWLSLCAVLGMVLYAWAFMMAVRGSDIRTYEGGLTEVSPIDQLLRNINMYSPVAEIVWAFPDQFEFRKGESLIPLLFGWVPRSVWPDKPYPFSSFLNYMRGETLENRAASLAPSLPGEGYGNFGLPGVFLWAAMLGLACRFADRFITGLQKTNPLRWQLAIMIGIWAAMLVRGGIPEMFYMGLHLTLFPIGLAIYLDRRQRSRLI